MSKNVKYVIVPKFDYKSEEITAKDKDEALINFATTMDTDMNNYFVAIPADEYGSYIADIRQKMHEQTVTDFMKDELIEQFGLSEEDAGEVADEAYCLYETGEHGTEYDCIEEAYDKWEKENAA